MNSFVDLLQLIASNMGLYVVTFLAVLSLLVFIHELGHYLVARWCGVKVVAFSIGFGKELLGWTDGHGTRWKLSLIPLGGYVKMFGDIDPTSAGHKDGVQMPDGEVRPFSEHERSMAFFAKPVWQRALVVFAGPAINFLFAIAVLAALYCSLGKPITPPVASAVEIGGAADKAGFIPGDKVLSINGRDIYSFDGIRREVLIALDTPMAFEVARGDKIMTLTAIPKKMEEADRFGFKHEKGYLGLIGPANGLDITKIVAVDGADVVGKPERARALIMAKLDRPVVIKLDRGAALEAGEVRITPPASLNKHLNEPDSKDFNALILGVRPGDELLRFNVLTGLGEAVKDTGQIVQDTLKAIWQMVTGTRSATELGGIIRIGAIAGDMAERGFVSLAMFTALLSINLGLINLFPIPMLDGGHLLFYAAEAIKRKPLSERFQEYAFRFGMVVLVSLMIFANLNDILHIVSKIG